LVDKLILLNKQLRQYEDKLTSTRQKIEEELKNIESEIDEMVYKIYGITLDEKKLIEDSVKE